MPQIIMTTAGSKFLCATTLLGVLTTPLFAAPKPPAKGSPKVTTPAKTKKVDVAALNAALFQAIGYKDVVAVKRLLARGASANARNPLNVDAFIRERALLDATNPAALLKGKPNPALDRSQFAITALIAAVESDRGSVEIVRLLLQYGADVNATVDVSFLYEDYGMVGRQVVPRGKVTALDFAIRFEYEDITRVLLAAGAKLPTEQDMPRGNNARLDPLGMVLEPPHSNPVIAKLLLQAGAKTSLRSQDGTFALEHAVRSGHLDVVNLLLARGVSKDACTAALFPAAEKRHFKLFESLLKGGADPNEKDYNGFTPLHYIARQLTIEMFNYRSSLRLMQSLLPIIRKTQPNYDPAKEKTEDGKTVQEKADQEWAEFHAAVRALLAAGARPDELGAGNSTALQQAMQTFNVPLVELLLDNGADPNFTASPYPSPLRLLVHFVPPDDSLFDKDGDEMRIARKLIEKGADLKSRDNRSALGAACEDGNLPMVKLLLQSGASTEDLFEPLKPFLWPRERGERLPEDIAQEEKAKEKEAKEANRFSHRGFTPLLISARLGELDILRALLAAGANSRKTDARGETALHHLVRGGKWNPSLLSLDDYSYLTEPAEYWEKTRAESAANAIAAKLLLDSGCDAAAKNARGQKAIQIGLVNGDLQVVKVLQQTAPQTVPDSTLFTIINGGRRTIRIAPVISNIQDDLYRADSKFEESGGQGKIAHAALQAARKSQFAYLHKLLRYCGAQDVTAIQIAVTSGAKATARDNAGLTPLMAAVRVGHLEAAQQLLKVGSEINAVDRQGETVLMQAVRYATRHRKDLISNERNNGNRDSDVSMDLISIKKRENLIRTTLGREDAALISLLLKAGAKPNLKNPKGQTALDLARNLKHPEAVQVLRSIGKR